MREGSEWWKVKEVFLHGWTHMIKMLLCLEKKYNS